MKTLLFVLLSSFVGVACQSFDHKAGVDKKSRKYSSTENAWMTFKEAGMTRCKVGFVSYQQATVDHYLKFSQEELTASFSDTSFSCPREIRALNDSEFICPLSSINPHRSSCKYSCTGHTNVQCKKNK